MPNFISEAQIELALLQRLQHVHGYDVLKCQSEDAEDLVDGSHRSDKRDVFLLDRVREAAVRLNRKIPEEVIDGALESLVDRRQAMSLVAANHEIYELLRDGIDVEFDDANGRKRQERVRLIDFSEPGNNRYLAVSQLWVKGEPRFRRPDVLLYVNGIPLVFIELKNSNVKLKNAHDENVVNYRTEIPQLFLANAFCVLTNGIETKVGSFAADWEYFFNWLRVEDEKEKVNRKKIGESGTSIERVIEGLLAPQKLLDYVENFILYYKETEKIVAQNHQFLGVNRAYETFLKRKKLKGKLGVFWHTQGSGKSFSMIFYARNILRHQGGQFTFVIVTDREDLDGQIYRNFLDTAARANFAQRFQEIVDAYNTGSSSTENYYDELVEFTKEMKKETERHVREGLSEDELELFDLLKKEKMTKAETQKVKLAAKSLLRRLLEESPRVLVQDWYKDGQTKRQVKSAVEEVLNRHLPETYDRVLFKQKCDNVVELMVNYASQGLKWAA